MKSFEVNHNGFIYTVRPDRHAYRIRFFVDTMGYIGSYYPDQKIVRFYNGGDNKFTSVVRGKITGVKELINFQLGVA